MLSKFVRYSLGAAVVGFLVGSEITYWIFANPLQKQLKSYDENIIEDINEIFFTKQPVNRSTMLTRNMIFRDGEFLVYVEILRNILLSATKSIHLLMYIFTSKPLADALIEQKRRGVKVFVVVDHSMEGSSNYIIQRLCDEGIDVKIRECTTMHNKVALIDVPYDESKNELVTPALASKSLKSIEATVHIPKNGLVVTGSMNWTTDGFTKNEENFSVRSNKNVCENAARAFFHIWNSPQSRRL